MNILYGILSLIQVVFGSGSLVALLNNSIQIAIGFMLIIFIMAFIQEKIKTNQNAC